MSNDDKKIKPKPEPLQPPSSPERMPEPKLTRVYKSVDPTQVQILKEQKEEKK